MLSGKQHERRENYRAMNREVAKEILNAVRGSKEFHRVNGPNREDSKSDFSLGYFITFEDLEWSRRLNESVPVFYSISVDHLEDASGIRVRRTNPIETAEEEEKISVLEDVVEEIREDYVKRMRPRL
jgi:hypothetical protein